MTTRTTDETFMTPGRALATVVVVALIITIGYKLFSGGATERFDSNTVLPGSPATDASVNMPADFEVAGLHGDTFRLSDYQGKVLILDFWATWCGPCRKEVPQLNRIARENRDRGVEVVGLHIDDRGRSTREDILRFIDQFEISYRIGLANDDIFTSYLGERETAIPQTLVFDRQGRVVRHLVGYTDADARKLDEAINRALLGS